MYHLLQLKLNPGVNNWDRWDVFKRIILLNSVINRLIIPNILAVWFMNYLPGNKHHHLINAMKPTIHIIDDDIDILGILNIFFKKKGFTVIADHNGDSLDLKNDPDPQVYLVDINLIGKNGTDICKLIKKGIGYIPVVMMSANSELEKLSRECYADAFISKPFDINKILSVINNVVIPD